jgi:hypothetical protein
MRPKKNPYIINWLVCNQEDIVKFITLWQLRRYFSGELIVILGRICARSWVMYQCCFWGLFYMMFAVKKNEFRDLFRGAYRSALDDR